MDPFVPPPPSSPRVVIPILLSVVAMIMTIVVMATPGLMQISVSQFDGYGGYARLGPFRYCDGFDSCYNIDLKCQVTMTYRGGVFHKADGDWPTTVVVEVVTSTVACDELNVIRAFLMMTLLSDVTGLLCGIRSAMIRHFSLRSAIVVTCTSAFIAVNTMSITIAIFVNQATPPSSGAKSGNYAAVFSYGSILIIFIAVINSCTAAAYIRAKRLQTLDNTLAQPFIALAPPPPPPQQQQPQQPPSRREAQGG